MRDQSESVGELIGALAKAQGAFGTPAKTSTAKVEYDERRQSYTFKYAPLDEGFSAIRKPLSENGIALTQRPFYEDRADGRRFVMLETRISYADQWMNMVYPVADFDNLFRVDDNKYRFDPKKLGAAITYAKRYSLFSFLGIAGEDDMDGDQLDMTPGNGKRGPQQASTLKPLQGDLAKDTEGFLLTDIQNLSREEEFPIWARENRAMKMRLPPAMQVRVDKAFAERLDQVKQRNSGSASDDMPL